MKEQFSQVLLPLGDGYLPRVAETLLVLLVYLSLRVAYRRALERVVRQGERRFHLVKVGRLALNTLLVLSLYQLWLDRGWSLASFVGLLSAGFAIVFREPLLNFAGWIYLLTRRPFKIGDRVQLGQAYAGDVVDIGTSDFTLMEIGNWVDADQSTGRIVHVPNGLLFTQPLANYSEGFPLLWNELEVLLTYESDWRQAMQMLEQIAEQHCEVDEEARERTRAQLAESKRYLISYNHLSPSVYVSKADSGVMLTLRYLCEPRRRRGTESKLWQEIFAALLGRDDISLAYPTRRIVGDAGSGKLDFSEKTRDCL